MAHHRQRFRCTTKPRNHCPSQCQKPFVGYGRTYAEAKEVAEGKCQKAGCHTPGESPYSCNCGHSTVIEVVH